MRLNLVVGTQDLGRTRLAVSPLQNLIIGFWGWQPSRERRLWQRAARRNVPHAGVLLLELINAHPWYVPDFLSPILPPMRGAAGPSIADELEALRSIGDTQIRADLEQFETLPGVPRSVLRLREAGTRDLARVVDAARALFGSCLAEDWPGIQQRLRADIAHRAVQMATSGSESMVEGLSPRLSWSSADTLRVALGACGTAPRELTINLSGHGMLLTPSPFAGADTVVLTGSVTTTRQAVIAYPVIAPQPPAREHDGLVVLLGRGRARALRAVQGTATTTDLARRLKVGASTASEHAAALRAAGLVTTYRTGRNVHHTVTDLGRRLLADDSQL